MDSIWVPVPIELGHECKRINTFVRRGAQNQRLLQIPIRRLNVFDIFFFFSFNRFLKKIHNNNRPAPFKDRESGKDGAQYMWLCCVTRTTAALTSTRVRGSRGIGFSAATHNGSRYKRNCVDEPRKRHPERSPRDLDYPKNHPTPDREPKSLRRAVVYRQHT